MNIYIYFTVGQVIVEYSSLLGSKGHNCEDFRRILIKTIILITVTFINNSLQNSPHSTEQLAYSQLFPCHKLSEEGQRRVYSLFKALVWVDRTIIRCIP